MSFIIFQGISYNRDDTPTMCFNGVKTWRLGWYASHHVDIPVAGNSTWTGDLVGFAENGAALASSKMIIRIRSSVDYYIHFNRKIGNNFETLEGGDQVLVASRAPGIGYDKSNLLAKLSVNRAYVYSIVNEDSINLRILVQAIDTSVVPARARISIQFVIPTQDQLQINQAKPIQSPVRPTSSPVQPTTSAVKPTPAPVKPTPSPVQPTPAPVKPTPAPVKPTLSPVQPTPAPVKPTTSPVLQTPAPVKPTQAPVKLTPAPVKPTTSPARPTPVPVTPTPAPTSPTPRSPVVYIYFPIKPTTPKPNITTRNAVRPSPPPYLRAHAAKMPAP